MRSGTTRTRPASWLLVQFARPLRAPGKWLADLFLWSVKHTAFVREARDNVALWARNMRKIEDAHGLDES